MRVLLRDDIAGVGRRGDIVDVAGGFARNYLRPGGKAMLATDGVSAQAASMRRTRDLREAKDRGAAEAQAKVLAGAHVLVPARAGTGGRLFGSVTGADIAKAVQEQKGVEVDRHHFILEEPIKTVGTFEIPVHLFGDIATVVTVEVSAGD
jgi:large subunit ribosomal protein L9